MEAKVIQGPWKPPNLKSLLEREARRLLQLVDRYKQEQAEAEKKEGA